MSSALRALLAFRSLPEVERCDLCSRALGPRHEHVYSEREDGLVCACVPCASLLPVEVGPYRRIERFARVLDIASAQEQRLQRALGIPVGLACLQQRRSGSVRALYPGPLGVTEAELAPQAWSACCELAPPLLLLRADVEAVIVSAETRWHLASIDVVYELVGLLRRHRAAPFATAQAFLDQELGSIRPAEPDQRDTPLAWADGGARHGGPAS